MMVALGSLAIFTAEKRPLAWIREIVPGAAPLGARVGASDTELPNYALKQLATG
jgi:hypothetical protein